MKVLVPRKAVVKQNSKLHFLRVWIAMSALFFIFSKSALAATSGITYHGRLIEPDGVTPITGAVTFNIQIRTPNAANCIMYSETQGLNLGSTGVFALTIGDGTPTATMGLTLDEVFSNRATFNFDTTSSCVSSRVYTPALGDGRNLAVTFQSSTMSAPEAMPSQSLNYAPLAIEAEQISGYQATNLLRFAKSDGTLVNTSPLNDTEYAALVALVDGTSTVYAKVGDATNGTPIFTKSGSIGSTTVGDMWLDTSGASDVLKINTNSGIQSVVLATPGVGIGTSMIADGAITSAKIADHSITGVDLDAGIVISTTGTVSAVGMSTKSFSITNSQSPVNAVNFTVPSGVFTSYNIVYPTATPAVGQVMAVTDASTGQLGWVSPTAGSLASGNVFVGNSSGVATGVALTGDLSISNTGLTKVIGIQGVGVGTSAPTSAGQVLRYDGASTYKPAFLSMADIRSTTLPGTTIFPTTSCAVGQALSWSSLIDQFGCTSITLDGAAITTGTISAARLPASALSWASNAANIYNTNSGYVGIGTSTPSAHLEVVQDGNGPAALRLNGSSSDQSNYWLDFVPTVIASGDVRWDIDLKNNPGGSAHPFNGQVMSFQAGNVGIGTTAPAYKLDVNGAINATSLLVNGVAVGTGTSSPWLTSGTNIYNANAGYVGVGTTSPSTPLHVVTNAASSSSGQPALTLSGNNGVAGSGVGIQFTDQYLNPVARIHAAYESSGKVGLALGGISGDTVRISADGRLGVGTASPVGALDVRGGTSSPGTAATDIALFGQSAGAVGDLAGSIYLQAGGNVSSATGGGNVNITGGAAASGNHPGNVNISGGTSNGSFGGDVTLRATDSGGYAQGGNFFIYSGASANGNAGVVQMTSGGGGYSGNGGPINFQSGGGGTSSGNSGDITMTVGAAPGGSPGRILLNGGNVGIGTTAPAYSLDVNGAINATSLLVNGVAVGTGTSSPWLTSGTNIYKSNAGNVGIGTTAPIAPLTIQGVTSIPASSLEILLKAATPGDSNDVRIDSTSGGLRMIASPNALSTSPDGSSYQLWGNASTYPGQAFFDSGANDAAFVAIRTAPSGGTMTERIHVSSHGSVGIGTTAPGYALDVAGNVNASSFSIAGVPIGAGGASAWAVNGTDISNTNTGKVGVGTTNPKALLHVNLGGALSSALNANTDGFIVSKSVGAGDSASMYVLGGTGSGGTSTIYLGNDSTPYNGSISSNYGSNMMFSTSGAERLRIDPSGNIGIGTNAPSDMLTVTGNITTYGTISSPTTITQQAGAAAFPSSSIVAYATSGFGQQNFQRYRGTSFASPLAVADADTIGVVGASAYNGTQVENASQVAYSVDGVNASGSGNHPGGRIDFQVRGTFAGQYGYGLTPMTIRNSGNVGIGTTAPAYQLDVNGAINATSLLVNGVAIGAGGSSPWTVTGSNISSSNSGNVGIGTTSPGSKLEVTGVIVSTPSSTTGATVDVSASNTIVLSSVAGTAITTTNLVNGGNYTLVIKDTTARTYTFPSCATQKFLPANTATTSGTWSMYTILALSNGGGGFDCMITWATGYQ